MNKVRRATHLENVGSELSHRLSEAKTRLRRERDDAVEVAAMIKEIENLERTRSEIEAQAADPAQRLSEAEIQLQSAQDQVETLNQKIEGLTRARPERAPSTVSRVT